MNPLVTPENSDLLAGLSDLCRREITDERMRALDETARYPVEIMQTLGRSGWPALAVPESLGGGQTSVLDLAAVHEELAAHSLAVAQAYYSLWVLGAEHIARLGSPEQKDTWLPRLAKGDARVAFAMTEPECGSDAASLRTNAEVLDDGFVLSGQKVFITGAAVADVIIVAARTSLDARSGKGISLFLVDPADERVTVRKLSKIGLRAIDLCEVFLDQVHLSRADLLGELDEGWAHLRPGLAQERLLLAAISAGSLRDVLRRSLEYAKERTSFGKRIGDHQLVARKLVDMRIALAASYGLIKSAAEQTDDGNSEAPTTAAIAKVFATEAYVDATREGVQIFGGYGFTDDYAVSRHYRDCKYLEIGGGTSEIQRILVARAMGLEP